MNIIRYPIGEQSFERIRSGNYVYVDKTEIIHRLVSAGSYYFLSRPRRFGKSLLLSTLEAYFRGRRDLFKGLAIDQLQPDEWIKRPVVRLDLSGKNFNTPVDFTDYIRHCLEELEHTFDIESTSDDITVKFRRLVKSLHHSSGRKVVILIDEYDSPITRNVGRLEVQEEIRQEMQSFYSVIKPLAEEIHFCMLTGVTKYGKLSIFSSLNNLNDISFDECYTAICGITEAELRQTLSPGVTLLAEKYCIPVEQALERLKHSYDGYHFSADLTDIYNPFSLLTALSKGRIGEYWFETGTPTVLVEFLRNPQREIHELSGIKVRPEAISSISLFQPQLVALLYQTGYLTIKNYDRQRDRYTLGFPNKEVESGFFSSLLPVYANMQRTTTDKVADEIADAIYSGAPQTLADRLSAFIAGIPLSLHKNTGKYESHYQLILYLLFRLIGLNVDVEYQTSDGFIDILIQTNEYIYILELKVRGTAANALRQIKDKEYTLPFANDSRRLFRIGMLFDIQTHRISDIIIS
ncbi:MAG: ATP-binding protein [Muribaculaceae bacterium]|nr:ATP-binding protein [Muribaculaceae bacterium]